MYSKTKHFVTALILLLLAFLFTVPSLYLCRVTDELLLQTASARRAVEEGADPMPHLDEMVRLIEESAVRLRLFLDHNLVDETRMAIHAVRPMTDPEHLLSDLAALDILFDHLRNAEVFHLPAVL